MQFRHSWISPLLTHSFISTGSPALSIFLNVDMWIDCAISVIGGIERSGEDSVVVDREVISRKIGSPVLVLIGELDCVELTVLVVDFAGEVGDEDNRHVLRIVIAEIIFRQVVALGRHAHVVGVEQLLNPPGLLHGKPRGLDLVLLLVLLVVERRKPMGDGD